ncbi:heterokaryon incompatibility protein [Colletotrichum asianum]|uniref:Heterokaryon incompatibility protein n=1 Tax=Colletotrichum asianum TaxID=702518 RepID=A0A8H3ZQR8_9PEZI|nr:heterokaryon incompatibility protein [Colletotrichum asianum]
MSPQEKLFSSAPVRDGQFRLLDILPAPQEPGTNPPIRCQLRVAALSDPPDYEAISYVWGSQDSDNEMQIEVSGQVFSMTKNLHAVLSQLRLPNKTRTVWADQICINQNDSAEKATIVPLMRQIYSRCRQGILWAGEIPQQIGSAHVQSLFEFLTYMADGGSPGAPAPQCMASETAFKGPISALVHLMAGQGSWFSRIWTVQEAVLPKEAVLLWGPQSIPWSTLIQATKTYTTEMPQDVFRVCEYGFAEGPIAGLIAVLVWLNGCKYDCKPSSAMQQWRGRQAHDPRDKVYALLGLFPSGTLPRVESCDYEIPVAEVYENLTLDLITDEQSLRPLVENPRLKPVRATPNLARWAIDLVGVPIHEIEYWHHTYDSTHFRADGGRRLEFQHQKGILGLTGVFVDTIERVEPGLILVGKHASYELLAETLQRWKSTGPDEEAFGRLITNDLVRDAVGDPVQRASAADAHGAMEYLRNRTGEEWIHDQILMTVKNSVYFTAKSGLIGRGHLETQAGDEVWVFNGGSVPFTVRPRGGPKPVDNDLEYDFVGYSYVHGIMDGEAYERGIESRFIWIH